jgi:hypothetical protein
MGGLMNFKDLPEDIQEMLKSSLGNLGGGPPKNKKLKKENNQWQTAMGI